MTNAFAKLDTLEYFNAAARASITQRRIVSLPDIKPITKISDVWKWYVPARKRTPD